MLIRTNVLRWLGDCPYWIVQWLTPEQWSRLRHVGHVTITVGCLTVPPAVVLQPGQPVEVNPRSPRAGLPVQPPAEAGYGPTPAAGLLPPIPVRAFPRSGPVVPHRVPEPAGLAVLVTAIWGLVVVKRRARPAQAPETPPAPSAHRLV